MIAYVCKHEFSFLYIERILKNRRGNRNPTRAEVAVQTNFYIFCIFRNCIVLQKCSFRIRQTHGNESAELADSDEVVSDVPC